MLNWSLSDLELNTTIAWTMVTSILIALFYFYGRLYNVDRNEEIPKQDYVITGLHFFLFYIFIPLTFFLVIIPIPNLVYNYAISNPVIVILIQFAVLIVIEQIANETDIIRTCAGLNCNISNYIRNSCITLEKNCLLKYAIILIVIPFEYPSFILGYKLKEFSNLSGFLILFISFIVVFLSLAYLAISLGKLHNLADSKKPPLMIKVKTVENNHSFWRVKRNLGDEQAVQPTRHIEKFRR